MTAAMEEGKTPIVNMHRFAGSLRTLQEFPWKRNDANGREASLVSTVIVRTKVNPYVDP